MHITSIMCCFFGSLWLVTHYYQQPANLKHPKPTPFNRSLWGAVIAGLSVVLSSSLFFFLQKLTLPGNTSVMVFLLFLLGSCLISGLLCFLFKRSLSETRFLLPLTVLLDLTLPHTFGTTSYFIQVAAVSLFLFFCSVFLTGIEERTQDAPISALLQGIPLRLLALFLIWLSLSFFQGVFYGQLF
jgi:hypothetical protein